MFKEPYFNQDEMRQGWDKFICTTRRFCPLCPHLTHPNWGRNAEQRLRPRLERMGENTVLYSGEGGP